jgi:beta-glucosidase
VVQLYVAYPDSAVQRPIRQLRGFRRVHIDAGATAHVTFPLKAEDLAYYDETTQRFTTEAGKTIEVQIGSSSADIRLRANLSVTKP